MRQKSSNGDQQQARCFREPFQEAGVRASQTFFRFVFFLMIQYQHVHCLFQRHLRATSENLTDELSLERSETSLYTVSGKGQRVDTHSASRTPKVEVLFVLWKSRRHFSIPLLTLGKSFWSWLCRGPSIWEKSELPHPRNFPLSRPTLGFPGHLLSPQKEHSMVGSSPLGAVP